MRCNKCSYKIICMHVYIQIQLQSQASIAIDHDSQLLHGDTFPFACKAVQVSSSAMKILFRSSANEDIIQLLALSSEFFMEMFCVILISSLAYGRQSINYQLKAYVQANRYTTCRCATSQVKYQTPDIIILKSGQQLLSTLSFSK